MALQTTLGWVIMRRNKGSSNQFSANKMSINPDIDKIVQKFWVLESYDTTEIESTSIMRNIKQSKGFKPPLMYLTIITRLVYYGKTAMLLCQTISH